MSGDRVDSLYKWEESNSQTIFVEKQEDEFSLKEQAPISMNEIEAMEKNSLQDKVDSVQKHMPRKLEFKGKAQMLMDKNYSFKDGKKIVKGKFKTYKNGLMGDVTSTLKKLENLLETPVSLSKESVEKMEKAFLDVCNACRKYIKNRNPWTSEGKARKQMVEDFYEQVSWESQQFYEYIKSYQSGKNKVPEGATWESLITEIRTNHVYEDQVDGVTINRGGGCTSDLYIIDIKGEKKFFKEEETLPEFDAHSLFDREINAIEQEKQSLDNKAKDKEKHLLKLDLYKSLIKEVDDKSREVHKENQSSGLRGLYRGKNLVETYLAELSMKTQMSDKFMNAKKEYDEIKEKIKLIDEKNEEELEMKAELEKQLAITDYAQLIDSVFNVAKALTLQQFSVRVPKIDKGSKMAKRNVASSRMADMLGLSGLIVHSEMTDITINGRKMRGVMMDKAPGEEENAYRKKEINEYKKDNVDYTGEITNENQKTYYSTEAYQQLLSLQVLDFICGQVDRHGANYFIEMEKDEHGKNVIKKITGIDNDTSFGKLDYNTIHNNGYFYHFIRNMEVDDVFVLPAMDVQLAAKIKSLTPEIIKYMMVDLLDETECEALINRIQGVQKAIIKQENREKNMIKKKIPFQSKFISEKQQWAESQRQVKKNIQETAKNQKERTNMIGASTYLRFEWLQG